MDSYNLELKLIKDTNTTYYNNNPKKPRSLFKKYIECYGCNNFIHTKSKLVTHFYKKDFICADCWRRFIDSTRDNGKRLEGISNYCSFCKKMFPDYDEYYKHHFTPSHLY